MTTPTVVLDDHQVDSIHDFIGTWDGEVLDVTFYRDSMPCFGVRLQDLNAVFMFISFVTELDAELGWLLAETACQHSNTYEGLTFCWPVIHPIPPLDDDDDDEDVDDEEDF